MNSGTAVVGVIGTDARRSFAAIGDPVNTAARLMSAGAPGDVIVGRTTWDLIADPSAGVGLGTVRVKGKRDPVEAWRLTVA
jgi:class 3 adenylate cyclase